MLHLYEISKFFTSKQFSAQSTFSQAEIRDFSSALLLLAAQTHQKLIAYVSSRAWAEFAICIASSVSDNVEGGSLSLVLDTWSYYAFEFDSKITNRFVEVQDIQYNRLLPRAVSQRHDFRFGRLWPLLGL